MEEPRISLDPLTYSVVRLRDSTGSTIGTGFLVAGGKLLLTCGHLLADAAEIDFASALIFPTRQSSVIRRDEPLTIEGTASVEAGWVSRSPDVAVLRIVRLKIPEALDGAPIGLKLGSSLNLDGRRLRTYGFPAAKLEEGLPGRAEVLGETAEEGSMVITVSSREATSGFSGAPAFDPILGVVVGIFSSAIDPIRDPLGRGSETAFVVPINYARTICPELALPDHCPYKNLDAFTPFDADDYFGRDAILSDLVELLRRNNFVAVVGASGSGKSSLVRAGLAKAPSIVANPPAWLSNVHTIAPGAAPLGDVLLALEKATGQAVDQSHSPADLEKLSASGVIAAALRLTSNTQLVLVVDQFERIFTESTTSQMRDAFVQVLLAMANDRLRVCIVLRADFYGQALAMPGLDRALTTAQLTVVSMGNDELKKAIVLPAERCLRSFQPGLSERLVEELEGRTGDLPLLQFALTELWNADAATGVLTIDTYKRLSTFRMGGADLNGVQGLVVRRAEEIWGALDEAGRKAAKKIFLALVRPLSSGLDGSAKGISQRAWESELTEAPDVVEKLAKSFLLTRSYDRSVKKATLEIAHEALVVAWPRLNGWVVEHDAFLTWQNRDLRPYLRRWLDRTDDPSLLLPESMVPEAERYLEDFGDLLDDKPAEYIRLSATARVRSRRRRKLALAAFAAVLCLAGVLSGMTWWTTLKGKAYRAGDLYARALTALDDRDYFTAEVLLANAIAVDDRAEFRDRLVDARLNEATRSHRLYKPDLTFVATTQDGRLAVYTEKNGGREIHVFDVAGAGEVGPGWSSSSEVKVGAFDPDNQVIAIGDETGRVSVWKVADGAKLGETESLRASITGIVTCRGGDRIAYGDHNGHLWVWDRDSGTPQELHRSGSLPPLSSLAFDTTCERLAAGGSGNVVNVWSHRGPQWIGTEFTRHTDDILGVLFAPDGELVSVAADATVRFSNADGRELQRLTHQGDVNAVAVSADGRSVLSGSADQTVRLWDRATGTVVLTLSNFAADIRGVGFVSDDATQVFTYDSRGDIRVFDVGTKPEVKTWRAPGTVSALAFHPDGRRLVSVGDDAPDGAVSPLARPAAVHLWDVDSGRLLQKYEGSKAALLNVAFSAKGDTIAASARNGDVLLWNADTAARLPSPPRHKHEAWGLAFDDDIPGATLITGGRDSVIQAWSIADQMVVWSIELPPNSKDSPDKEIVLSMALGPMSSSKSDQRPRLLAVGGNKLHLFDYVSRREIEAFPSSRGFWGIDFDGKGASLAAGGSDRAIHLFDCGSGSKPTAIPLSPMWHHDGTVNSVRFCGPWLASAGADGVVKLLDAKDRDDGITLHGHIGPIWWLACDPNEKVLASGGVDGRIRLYDLASIDAVREAAPWSLVADATKRTGLYLNGDEIIEASEE